VGTSRDPTSRDPGRARYGDAADALAHVCRSAWVQVGRASTADLTSNSIWVSSACAYEPTTCVANTEKNEDEVLYSDSICTDGLRFNGRLIRGSLAYVGKRQPWPHLCRPKRGRAVAGKDLVLPDASLQQRGHRRIYQAPPRTRPTTMPASIAWSPTPTITSVAPSTSDRAPSVNRSNTAHPTTRHCNAVSLP
jgi:hypothetical protein